MDVNVDIFPVLLFLGILLIFFIIGMVIKRKLTSYLQALIKKTGLKWNGDFIKALSKAMLLWFGMAGVSAATHFSNLPPSIKGAIDKILVVLGIITITWILIKISTNLIQSYMEKTQQKVPTTTLLANIVKGMILVIGALMILQALGISIAPVLTTLGIGGLAVALAIQPTLTQLFSGMQILASRQVKLGDYIKLDAGHEGYVADITWRNTIIKTLENNVVVVPNAKLVDNIITNYHLLQKESVVRVQLGVSYTSDLEKVEEVTRDVARQVMKDTAGLTTFEPLIRYHAFGDFSINFTVIMRAGDVVDQYLIQHEFIKRLHKRYNQEGIEIPFPVTTVQMHHDT
jgi:small-conductance mechanosensitive channel